MSDDTTDDVDCDDLPGEAEHDENIIAFPTPVEVAEAESVGGAVPLALLLPAIEACLFAMPGVVTVLQLAEALQISEAEVDGGLGALRERMFRTGSGLRLVPVGAGWQLRTDTRLAVWVAAVRGGKPVRLSRAALETLSVVAFRQPVSKGAIDDLRGVDSGGILRTLLDRGLIRMAGRSDEPGRPMTYGTTSTFMELFGLRTLADLPTLKDLHGLADDDPGESVVPVVPFPEPKTGE